MESSAALYALPPLRTFVTGVLTSNGVAPKDADVVAERMLEADARGVPSHGITRLAPYVERVRAGGYNLDAKPRAVRESPVSALVDGDNGFGQVVMTYAADLAAEKAAASGLAWVGVRNSNHAGAGGVYAARALEHDLIGLYGAIGNANHMAPWGGVAPLLSTNPLAVAIPAGEQPPVVLDMATTVVSFGRLKLASQRGEQIPDNWVMDTATGEPVTDPAQAMHGLLLPIGGYKGYGLNLVIGMLAGTLNGAAFGSETIDFNHDHASPTNTGNMILMVRPDLFRPLEEFKASADARIRELRESRPVDPARPVRTPGDAWESRQRRSRERGVPIEPGTVAKLTALGAAHGIALPAPAGEDDR
ncbi:Ldh family oxidoreductase [Actinacidiphila reveromycinica]|uniref:Ldh family oxidoreductase n=1 Tax=Actinacidiphila reveromycinica TaxID=659352 RepID=UPI0019216F28|nr:Ldh family oxidoreductase [Streptomyces sp. SN-593]